jgi:hypothetical protein
MLRPNNPMSFLEKPIELASLSAFEEEERKSLLKKKNNQWKPSSWRWFS